MTHVLAEAEKNTKIVFYKTLVNNFFKLYICNIILFIIKQFKMNTYVKTVNYPFWRLYWNDATNEPITDYMDRRLKKTMAGVSRGNRLAKTNLFPTMAFATAELIGKPLFSYAEMVSKYGAIAINSVGGWCYLSNDTITHSVTANSEPSERDYKLVICENDEFANNGWIEKMKKFDSDPLTISFFNSRSQVEINDVLKDVTFCTFSTTFTNFDWFKKMLIGCPKNAQIIGSCADDKKWFEAEKIAQFNGRVIKRVL